MILELATAVVEASDCDRLKGNVAARKKLYDAVDRLRSALGPWSPSEIYDEYSKQVAEDRACDDDGVRRFWRRDDVEKLLAALECSLQDEAVFASEIVKMLRRLGIANDDAPISDSQILMMLDQLPSAVGRTPRDEPRECPVCGRGHYADRCGGCGYGFDATNPLSVSVELMRFEKEGVVPAVVAAAVDLLKRPPATPREREAMKRALATGVSATRSVDRRRAPRMYRATFVYADDDSTAHAVPVGVDVSAYSAEDALTQVELQYRRGGVAPNVTKIEPYGLGEGESA